MNQKRLFRPALYFVLFSGTSFCLRAQTAEGQPSDANKSWTATTEAQVSSGQNPTRTTETHKQDGNRTLDIQKVERLGPDGHFEPYYETEKETVQVNATTVRTVVRTFGRDGAGQRSLTQMTEEDKQGLPGGNEKVVRTTAVPDMDGHTTVMQREVTNTTKAGADSQESKTTVFVSDGRGGLAPASQSVERRKRSDEHTIEVQKTTQVKDGGGNWQVSELKESTIKEDGKNRTTDERISRPGPDGKLAVLSRTVAKEAETATGERHDSVETYSPEMPGSSPDGSLHLSQRVTTVRKSSSGARQATEEQIERANPGDPRGGLQMTQKSIEIISTDESGKLQTRTVQVPDGSGNLGVVSVETRKSNQTDAVQVEIAPKDKPK